jgi:tetratricopeptide (TPR) repeat protein
MSLQIIPNIIIFVSLFGIVLLFVRRLPEALEEGSNTVGFGGSSSIPVITFGDAMSIGMHKSYAFFKNAAQKLWHFMLEAKDLQQGQILASKFARLMTPSAKRAPRVINMAAYNAIKKAESLFDKKDFETSEAEYIAVIRKYPHEYAAYEGLLKIYMAQKKYEEIVDILDYLIEHNPQNDTYLVQLGNVLLTSRKYKEAINSYQKSLQINNLVPSRYANIGLAYRALDDIDGAVEYFKQALDLEPANMQYLTMLVDVLVSRGDAEEARKMLNRGLEMDANNQQIKEMLENLSVDKTGKTE